MISDVLHDDSHVVRYAKPSSILEDGSVDGTAFRLRSDDAGLSVNWLECFDAQSTERQVAEVRRLSRITMRPNGRLAELNVGRTKQETIHDAVLRFVRRPLVAEGGYEADPSHSEILDLPPGNSPRAALIGDLIAESVTALHPAIADSRREGS